MTDDHKAAARPDLSEDAEAAARARAERSSDAHDPEAKAAWLGLLSFLSDDELARYGEIARDQLDQESQRAVLQWGSAVAGVGLAVAAFWGNIAGSVAIGTLLLALAVGFGLEYWVWKKLKARRLWQSHIEAVAVEQAQRRETGPAATAAE